MHASRVKKASNKYFLRSKISETLVSKSSHINEIMCFIYFGAEEVLLAHQSSYSYVAMCPVSHMTQIQSILHDFPTATMKPRNNTWTRYLHAQQKHLSFFWLGLYQLEQHGMRRAKIMPCGQENSKVVVGKLCVGQQLILCPKFGHR